MEASDRYKVLLRDVPERASYEWHLTDEFFETVRATEVKHGVVDVKLNVRHTAGAYELDFSFEGNLMIPCDRCLEMMEQPVAATRTLKVKLGDHIEDDGELVTVPAEDGYIDVAWNLYEFIALEIPMRHVHENDACQDFSDGQETKKLSAVSAEPSAADPRWNALKKLLNNK